MNKSDDRKLIQHALELAQEQEWFDDTFLHSLEESLAEYDSLTDNQRRAVKNIVKMLKSQAQPSAPKRKDVVLLEKAYGLARQLGENTGFLDSLGNGLKEYSSFTPRQRKALSGFIEKMEGKQKGVPVRAVSGRY